MKKYRRNPIGIAVLPQSLHDKVMPATRKLKRPDMKLIDSFIEQRQIALSEHGYHIPLPVPPETPNVEPEIPELPADGIVESFELMASDLLGSFESECLSYRTADIPEPPKEFVENAGWTRYAHDGSDPQTVDYPYESFMALDFETLVQKGSFPIMGAAVTQSAWYIWLHPCLVVPSIKVFEPMLVPVGYGKTIVGHNISYDRVRIAEEYTVADTYNRFVDTMSMHTCVAGLAADQRNTYQMFANRPHKPAWFYKGSPKNLIDCYNFHMFGSTTPDHPKAAKKSDKSTREIFVDAPDHKAIVRKLGECVRYMLSDVHRTRELFCCIYPKFRRSCPSIVTLAAMILSGSSILPVSNDWHSWLAATNLKHTELTNDIEKLLNDIAKTAVENFKVAPERVESDPWLKNLDWTPAKTGKNKGLPAWWRKCKKKVTSKSTAAPYLLKLAWRGVPMIKVRNAGWCIPLKDMEETKGCRVIKAVEGKPKPSKETKGYREVALTSTDTAGPGWYGQIPHKEGGVNNVGSPLAKDYIYSFESGAMTGSEQAVEILKKAACISYWTSCKKRVMSQIVVKDAEGNNIVVPQMIVAGTGTRRPVESLWLTTTSSKAGKLGSGLKAMVRPPAGYLLVSADFAAQEMALAGRMADSFVGRGLPGAVIGSTPIGCLVVTGNKENGTDAHTQLKDYLNNSLIERRGEEHETVIKDSEGNLVLTDGIGRQSAKQPNFAILYGSGVRGLTGTFQKERIEWPEEDCKFLAEQSIRLRKGHKDRSTWTWVGGTDSDAFNFMEAYANAPVSKTPIFEACISEALRAPIVKRDFMTSRTNAAIQSSGQDLSHALMVALTWLAKKHTVDMRYIFLIHDEVVCLAKQNEALRASQIMNLAHLWTWALCSVKLKLADVPASSAWFPDTNIDIIMRKEVKIPNVTPTLDESKLPDGFSIGPEMFTDGKWFLSTPEESAEFTKRELSHLIEYQKENF